MAIEYGRTLEDRQASTVRHSPLLDDEFNPRLRNETDSGLVTGPGFEPVASRSRI